MSLFAFTNNCICSVVQEHAVFLPGRSWKDRLHAWSKDVQELAVAYWRTERAQICFKVFVPSPWPTSNGKWDTTTTRYEFDTVFTLSKLTIFLSSILTEKNLTEQHYTINVIWRRRTTGSTVIWEFVQWRVLCWANRRNQKPVVRINKKWSGFSQKEWSWACGEGCCYCIAY